MFSTNVTIRALGCDDRALGQHNGVVVMWRRGADAMSVDLSVVRGEDGSISRRALFRAGGAAVAGLTIGAVPGCAAPVAFNPATVAWFAKFATAVGASVIATRVNEAITGAWSAWSAGRDRAWAEQSEQGFTWRASDQYGDAVPPAVFTKALRTEEHDPFSDRLVVLVDTGNKSVVFEPWAWQTLWMFIDDMTAGRSGDDAAAYRGSDSIGPGTYANGPAGREGLPRAQKIKCPNALTGVENQLGAGDRPDRLVQCSTYIENAPNNSWPG